MLLGLSKFKPLTPIPEVQFFDTTLNQSQRNAVRFVLEGPDVACIHGPPGTGKTHTLVEVIRQLVARGDRVLVCGASNLAVDNLLERLVQYNIPLLRIGHAARVMPALVGATLDAQAGCSDEFILARDVRNDLEAALAILTGKGKGKLRGSERHKLWQKVKELRKE